MSRLTEYARLSATALKGDHDAGADEFRRLGIDAYHEGKLDQAERLLGRATHLAPERPDLHAVLGAVVYDRGKYEEAAQSFATALNLDPGQEDALLGMGAALHAMGRVSDAIFYYLSFLRLQPDNVVAMTNLGNAFAHTGQLEEAAEMFERSVQLQPDNAQIHAAYGRALYNVGKIEDAVGHLRLAVDAGSEDGEVYRLLGLALIGRDDLDGARALLERALELNPSDVAAYIDLTALLHESGEPRKAVEVASQATEIADKEKTSDTVRAHAYWQLGWAYYRVSEWRKSAEASKTALEADPQLVPPHFNLALALLRAGDATAAREEYEATLGLIDNALDLKALAINDLKAAMSEDGGLAGGREMLDVLERRYRELLESRGSPPKANA
jgi:tetratricopeptide (TPR) repeat protein